MSGGSSPHIRGTPREGLHLLATTRLIPAHTGNTAVGFKVDKFAAAHPRTYGEHLRIRGRKSGVSGSSPHIRGTHAARGLWRNPIRLIPAHTGNTYLLPGFQTPKSAHPRTYGEHTRNWRNIWNRTGSSPHIRGTRALSERVTVPVRLIPAHTGNTYSRQNRNEQPTAHPRTYGEHSTIRELIREVHGSSPHIRGTPPGAPFGCGRVRLIPAHTGNTLPCLPDHRRRAAHPRTYGEHGSIVAYAMAAVGSSPHIRGARTIIL